MKLGTHVWADFFFRICFYSLRKRHDSTGGGVFLRAGSFSSLKPDCVQERSDSHTFGSSATLHD